MRFTKTDLVTSIVYHFVGYYPAPSIITYFWSFGFLAGVCLVVQILTGVGLAMHYCPNIEYAFSSVEHIMRDVNGGWLMRYVHANGASCFFLCLYIHILRGLYYHSYVYPREHLWGSGVILFIVAMATAFMGYVLPWGQMSFWAATVITNLFSIVPLIGSDVVLWLWGGFSVDNPTLNKFYSIHFLLPFVLVGLMLVHLMFLHEYGSSNVLGVVTQVDQISFLPYLTVKDAFSILLFFCLFGYFALRTPNYLNHPDNMIPANPLVTPAHIVPEWYLLMFYAILRSIPDKLGGVIAMALSLLVLLFLPWVASPAIRSNFFRVSTRFFFWCFAFDCIILGWIGGNSVASPFYEIGQLATFYYFFYFMVILPITAYIEQYYLNNYPYKKC